MTSVSLYRKNLKLLAIWICLLLPAGWLHAQHEHWTSFTVQNSEIGGNTILAIVPDAKNNLWVGTNLGLCRLSGRTWTDYAMFNTKLKDQFVNCLTVDANGSLWIGTDDYGVIEFDGTRWTEYSQETRKHNMKFIRDIVIDKRGNRWIGVTLGGLVKFDNRGEWSKFTAKDSELLSDFILCIDIDAANKKWIGTNDGLCVFDDNRWTTYTTRNSKMPSDIVPAVVVDNNNVKWIGTLEGLCRYDEGRWEVFTPSNSMLPVGQINDMAFDANGALWIATTKGVAVFDGKNSWKVYNTANSGLSGNVVQKLAVDARGCKWFGTDFHGLDRFAAHGIQGRITDGSGRPCPDVMLKYGEETVATDRDGFYYIEVPNNANVTIVPDGKGTFEPEQRSVSGVKGFVFGQDFVYSTGMVAKGNSSERVTVNPYLEQGYVTITFESPVAEVKFVDAQGNTVRTIAQYKSGDRITVTRMPRIKYTLYVTTKMGQKSIEFNLR